MGSVEGARPREALLPIALKVLPLAEGARRRARVPPAAPSERIRKRICKTVARFVIL